jgi:hypothetical protein
MANEEHLALLRLGVKEWNLWRIANKNINPNLSGANLSGANLNKANLREVDLSTAVLFRTNFFGADLHKADLSQADLRQASLSMVRLHQAILRQANLHGANLSGADLREANLYKTSLREADLSTADLSQADLRKVEFTNSIFGYTRFADVDLSVAKNLHLTHHRGPSTVGIDTLYKSNGNIPLEFLEGCGVPETMITFAKSLVGTAIEYYSCFISYSTKDDEFARQLNDRMKRGGLRVWFAPEEMKGGKKIHEQLYEAIRYHDKLILVLSAASMNSTWVQTEIKRARKHEREDKRRKLFPISLVPFGEIQKWELFDGDEGRDLAQEIREYYIPDFSRWKDYDKFTTEFEKLLRALRADE